jgi:hypothetical protein
MLKGMISAAKRLNWCEFHQELMIILTNFFPFKEMTQIVNSLSRGNIEKAKSFR